MLQNDSFRNLKNVLNMEYYVSINNEKRGPYSVEELRARGVTDETLVMADDGNERWQAAWQIDEIPTGIPIQEEKEEEPRQPVAVPPVPPVPVKKKKSRLGCLLTLLLVAVVVAAMVFTCPDSRRHKEVVTNVMTETLNDMSASGSAADDLLTHGIRVVGDLLVGNVTETAIDKMLTVDNYFVCSIGKIHYDGKDHVVSAGILGHVFTINKEDLTKAAEKYYRNIRQEAEDAVRQQIRESVVDPIDEALGGIFNDIMGGQPNQPDRSDSSEQSDQPDTPDPSSESNL